MSQMAPAPALGDIAQGDSSYGRLPENCRRTRPGSAFLKSPSGNSISPPTHQGRADKIGPLSYTIISL